MGKMTKRRYNEFTDWLGFLCVAVRDKMEWVDLENLGELFILAAQIKWAKDQGNPIKPYIEEFNTCLEEFLKDSDGCVVDNALELLRTNAQVFIKS